VLLREHEAEKTSNVRSYWKVIPKKNVNYVKDSHIKNQEVLDTTETESDFRQMWKADKELKNHVCLTTHNAVKQ